MKRNKLAREAERWDVVIRQEAVINAASLLGLRADAHLVVHLDGAFTFDVANPRCESGLAHRLDNGELVCGIRMVWQYAVVCVIVGDDVLAATPYPYVREKCVACHRC